MRIKTLLVGMAGIAVSTTGFTATETNSMTNIATVVGGCDIVAIGVNFGLVQSPMTAADTSFTANTATGNALAGNPDHADFSADGVSPDDDLTLTTGVSAVDTVLTPIVSAVIGTSAGVFVACTATPGDITVESSTTAATTLSQTDLATTAFSSNMTHTNTTDALSYALTFTTAVIDTSAVPLINAFVGAFVLDPLTGASIPNAGTLVAGDYTDVVTATVNF